MSVPWAKAELEDTYSEQQLQKKYKANSFLHLFSSVYYFLNI